MRHITQAEFDALPIVDGVRQCPTADYSAVESFDRCRFGDGCSFARACSFADGCRFGAGCSFEGGHTAVVFPPFLCIGPIGSRGGATYVFNFVDGLYVRCGCFFGTIEQFAAEVDKTHADNVHGRNYRALIEMAKGFWPAEANQ